MQASVIFQPLNYSVALQPSVPWAAARSGGSTPGTVSISLTCAALVLPASVSDYKTSVAVTCLTPSPCAGKTQCIGVSLTVKAAPALLSVGTSRLSFSANAANPAPSSQTLSIENKGGGSLGVRSISSPDGWVTSRSEAIRQALFPAIPGVPSRSALLSAAPPFLSDSSCPGKSP